MAAVIPQTRRSSNGAVGDLSWKNYLDGGLEGVSEAVVLEGGQRVRLFWVDGHSSQFSLKWLRDHSDGSFHVNTMQRKMRYHEHYRAPLNYLSTDDIDLFYKHHQSLMAIMRDPCMVERILLEPGDTMVFNNHRALHGRESYKVFSHHAGSSGPSYITGWLSAFTCFDTKGRFLGEETAENSDFPRIDDDQICHNVVSCPVKIVVGEDEYDGTLLVGQVAFEAEKGEGHAYPTIRPRNDWCMVVAVKD